MESSWEAVGPHLRHCNLEGRQWHHEQVLERPVLALADDRGAGQDDRQHADLVDDGYDALEPGRLGVRVEQPAHHELHRLRPGRLGAFEEARDAVGGDGPDIARPEAGLLHGSRVDAHLYGWI